MADIKIDEELLLRAGLGIGYAFAPFFRGIMNGVEDYTIEQAAREMQEEHDAQEAEEGFKVSKPFAQRTRSSICGAGS